MRGSLDEMVMARPVRVTGTGGRCRCGGRGFTLAWRGRFGGLVRRGVGGGAVMGGLVGRAGWRRWRRGGGWPGGGAVTAAGRRLWCRGLRTGGGPDPVRWPPVSSRGRMGFQDVARLYGESL